MTTEPKEYYERNLHHYQPADATFFVTFRLAGSLPRHVVQELQAERLQRDTQCNKISDLSERQRAKKASSQCYFERFDALLDRNTSGPFGHGTNP